MFLQASTDKFRCIVDTKEANLFCHERLGGGMELHEKIGSFIPGFHKVKGSETGEAIDKKDEITIRGVRRGKWAANITMSLFK